MMKESFTSVFKMHFKKSTENDSLSIMERQQDNSLWDKKRWTI
jgi:hypothetical protein